MKPQLRHIEIEIGKHASGNISAERIRIYRNPRNTDNGYREYPLTERNYWRAVGMQLKLAGFVKEKEV